MRRVVIILGILAVLASAVAALPLQEQCARMQADIVTIKQQTGKDQGLLEVLKSRKEKPLLKATQYFTQFMSLLNHEADIYAFKARAQILDDAKNNNGSVAKEYEGIKKIMIKLSFYQVGQGDEALRILRHFSLWQQQYPFVPFSFVLKDNLLQITGGIYGL